MNTNHEGSNAVVLILFIICISKYYPAIKTKKMPKSANIACTASSNLLIKNNTL